MNDWNENESALSVSEKLLTIEVTTHCNLDCLHCFVRSKKGEHSLLSLSVVQDILKEGHDIGYRRLHLTGGEPLLWNKLLETLDYAFSLGYISILINTNGTLLKKDLCSTLADYERVFISVSLDGSESLHDRIRGNGQHERTMRGIEGALKAGIDTIIFTTIYKSLLSELPTFATALFDRFPSIRHLCLIPLMKTTANSFPLSDELLAPGDFIRLVRGISLLTIFGFRIDVLNEPLADVAADLLECPLIQWSQRFNHKESLIVMADKRIGLSHFSNTNFGQYRSGMLQKVLFSDEYEEAATSDDKICPFCRYHRLCIRHGMNRPSEPTKYYRKSTLYCKSVLDNLLKDSKVLRREVVQHARLDYCEV